MNATIAPLRHVWSGFTLSYLLRGFASWPMATLFVR